MNYTPDAISRGAGVYPLHDFIVIDSNSTFAELVRQRGDFYRHFCQNKRLRKALPVELVKRIRQMPGAGFSLLSTQYNRERGWKFRNPSRPKWFQSLPLRFQRILNVTHAMGEGSDPFVILPSLPFHGFGYLIEDNGLTVDLWRDFHIARLHKVKQLAYLHDPQNKNSTRFFEPNFPHSRMVHVYDATAVGNLIVANNPILESQGKLIRMGALLHDILTPAGGDTTKIIDRKAFDEDHCFLEVQTPAEWLDFEEVHGISRYELVAMVQGKGIAGKVLDLADKTAYMGRDMDNFLNRGFNNGPIHYPETYIPLCELARKNPTICALWAYAKVAGDQIVIEDAKALYDFLKVRALLFRGLYYNPDSKIMEFIVAKKLIGWAYHTGRIDRELLLTWHDGELSEWLLAKTGFILDWNSFDGCGVELFDTREMATVRQHQLEKDGSTLTVVEEFANHTKDGTTSFHVKKGKTIITFRDAYPDMARTIRELIEAPAKKFRLYWAKMDSLHIRSDKKLRKELSEFNCPETLVCPKGVSLRENYLRSAKIRMSRAQEVLWQALGMKTK